MSQVKRRKLNETTPSSPPSHHTDESDLSPDEAELGDASGPELSGSESDTGPDTEDEISGVKRPKSQKTLKRKRRATDAIRFGSALQSLLGTEAPSTLPLSLKPSVARKKNDEKLEAKGKKILQVERKDKEEKGRITDVIGGWGGESERALRKVAQRGVVKLFNVIQQSQKSVAVAEQQVKAQRGTGKPTLPAPSLNKDKKKGSQKPNALGKGKTDALDDDIFLSSIRSGGIVSKT